MENKLKVSEIFESIQGEGKYVGTPMLFIRLSGCTRKCRFCDTKYHEVGKKVSIKSLLRKVKDFGGHTVCFTGGEPLLQRKILYELIFAIRRREPFMTIHLETNGDLLSRGDFDVFSYIAISPKSERTARMVSEFRISGREYQSDVKIVTDLDTINTNLVGYASMLMPLTTYNSLRDWVIKRKVWEYSVKSGLHYSPRLHYEIWGKKRKK